MSASTVPEAPQPSVSRPAPDLVHARATRRSRRPARRLVTTAALIAALTAATYPAWRVLLLGSQPTLDELLQLRCSTPRPTSIATPDRR